MSKYQINQITQTNQMNQINMINQDLDFVFDVVCSSSCPSFCKKQSREKCIDPCHEQDAAQSQS